MGGVVFLTGATGFLGSQVARRILRDRDMRMVALVRGKDTEDARRRLSRAWDAWPEAAAAIGTRVEVAVGDLTAPGLGLDSACRQRLVRDTGTIVHAAAELELDGELEKLRRINVEGVRSLLDLAHQVDQDHGLERFAHVSTAYVAGGRTGVVAEGDLTDAHGFSNSYEKTKFEGESLVRASGLRLSVFRPGMVVGDAETGEIRAFNTVYVPLRLYLAGRLPLVPARRDMLLNVVPVDYVAEVISKLAFDPRAEGQTFHLTVSREHLPTAGDMLEAARGWAARNLEGAPALPRFIPIRGAERLASVRRWGVPPALLSYFQEDRSYRRDNVDRLLGPYRPDWDLILPRLLAFAAAKGFLRTTLATVHEQTLARLQSRRIPVRVHDIGAGGELHDRSGNDISAEVEAATGALKALGIARGDRVAILGLNSSRFLSLDTAIGLCGAVSVPLYYTSPAQEIEELVRSSGAKLLLVGAPDVLPLTARLPRDVVVASFCFTPVPRELEDRVLSWGAFMGLGAAADSAQAAPGAAAPGSRRKMLAPVDYQDFATVRYTSGTTGTPRGVAFTHGQVLWMAQTMAALLPWKVRVSPARYLSFLPMNHVVEGMLGTYAPAFIPAPVDIYFLQDFHALQDALPRVRPTVFFSVPRFYEKVWERFSAGRAGRLYVSLPTTGLLSVARAALRPMVRRGLLRRAGLGSCLQLIAGSAPCPEKLLRDFRELGVEIHNAYGLTEAPLVTLNRHGANVIGTVGAPLPETEVCISAEGEVLVRGPQVAVEIGGGAPDRTPRWFATGDLGIVGPDGRLSITGRKKELIITSYGKNINPGKIEALLRGIPGLAEAMVLGDGRPFLSAMLWLNGVAVTPRTLREIDDAVCRVNAGLSHPEQVKRWVILSDAPSIQAGELTGNLKLRRQQVVSAREAVVRMLYDSAPRPARGLVHTGESRCA